MFEGQCGVRPCHDRPLQPRLPVRHTVIMQLLQLNLKESQVWDDDDLFECTENIFSSTQFEKPHLSVSLSFCLLVCLFLSTLNTHITHLLWKAICMFVSLWVPVYSYYSYNILNIYCRIHNLLRWWWWWWLCFCRAFITWLANGETIRIFKMIKKDDGAFSFKAAPEDFPQKHKGIVMDMGIADTGSLYTFVQHCLCSLQLPSQKEKKLSVLSSGRGVCSVHCQ